MATKTFKEYSIVTPFETQVFEDKQEAHLYWNNLDDDTKERSQYFFKEFSWLKDCYEETKFKDLK